MKSFYYITPKERLSNFFTFLKDKRKPIFIPVAIGLIAGSFWFQDWGRLYLMISGIVILITLKQAFWEFPEMAYNYLFNKETPDVRKQRRFDNYTLPAMTALIALLVICIVFLAVTMYQGNGTYYPGWKSDINNMWANKFMQWVVDNLFPVKTYYSTFK